MDFQFTCTTEELAVLASLSGYPEFAKGIAAASYSERTEAEWNVATDVTIPHLIMKGIWNEEREANGLNPLTDNMQEFIKAYAESRRMIRCSNPLYSSSFVFHKVQQNTWLVHSIYKDIIHDFSFAEAEEIPRLIKEYYNFEITGDHSSSSFSLTDAEFDALSQAENAEQVLNGREFSEQHKSAYHKFTADLKENNWSLFNISNFVLAESEEDTYLENIIFFLPSDNGVWIAEYTEDPAYPVAVTLEQAEEWTQRVNGVGFIAANTAE
ncbi:hypothetical protein LRR81_08035 [Metabacillus sp. GX 13764]|uniref:hypothetical protein n=1 Tax=Metabacillus kandeliae TaxID=2900151 RepID=UPI001E4E3D12|nr:hypothetical protein [Metabacillus kandeliae]MCD7034180.1 hypothetical protein [Metabacillus kandeliae]